MQQLSRAEHRRAHLIASLMRAARAARDLWAAIGVALLINTAAPALLSVIGVQS